MRNRIAGILICALSLFSFAAVAQEKKPEPDPMKLKVGDMAPDFTLLAYDGSATKAVSLHEFRGKKNVVVAFFVFAFTGG